MKKQSKAISQNLINARNEEIRRNNQIYYLQSKSVTAADYIIDHVLTLFARRVYTRYISERIPKHMADCYTDIYDGLWTTYLASHDENLKSNPLHVFSDDPEPVRNIQIYYIFS